MDHPGTALSEFLGRESEAVEIPRAPISEEHVCLAREGVQFCEAIRLAVLDQRRAHTNVRGGVNDIQFELVRTPNV